MRDDIFSSKCPATSKLQTVAPLQHKTFSSIRDIPRGQWDSVWPRLAEGWDFYLCQEEAGIEGFDFLYLALYSGDTLALVAPLFAARFNMGLAMDDAWRERLAKVQHHWPGLLVFKTLFCGSPTSEKGAVGIHPDFLGHAALLRALDLALIDTARAQNAWMIVFKDFMDAELGALSALSSLGYFTGDSLPTACLDIAFTSLDGYLDSLSSGTRKGLRRKLRQTEKSGVLQVEAVADIGHCIDDAYRLYTNVLNAGPMRFEVLTPAFFLNFTRYAAAQTVYFLYWMRDDSAAGRRLVGLNFCLQFEDRLIDKYIGMDYAVSRDLNLYFVSFVNNVQWCIDHGKTSYMLSQGGYPVKRQLGARLIPLRTMTKIVNPVFNWIANRFS